MTFVLAGLAAAAAPAPAEPARLRLVDLELPELVIQRSAGGAALAAQWLAGEFDRRKQALRAARPIKVVQDFRYLPLLLVEIEDAAMERALAATPGVAGVWTLPQPTTSLSATESANQMQAHLAQQVGLAGAGTSALITDAGPGNGPPAPIHPDFGPCTAIGTPAACQLASWTTAQPAGSSSHGLNVAAIFARTARAARIHFHDVASVDSDGEDVISTVSAFAALNWAIEHRDELNIVVHNMSWGSVPTPTSTCAMAGPTFQAAKAAGIAQVAASGNDSSAGLRIMRWPSCNPHVIGVGALDTSSLPWQVAAFSNAESVLAFVAPGVSITAAGFTKSGTSMAAPHVSGALAILAAEGAWDQLGVDALASQLRAQATFIRDPRLGIDFPMPMLFDARPLRLRVDNRFAASYQVTPAPPQGCGVDCFQYGRNALATLSVADPGVLPLHCDPGGAECTARMRAHRELSLLPAGVLAALPEILGRRRPELIFGNGFE